MSEIVENVELEQHKDYDRFHLNHLQVIRGDGARYQNQRFIGRGGNGTTFFVTCTSGSNYGVQFALKVFHKVSDDRRRQRFLDEVRHYRALTHPSIIGVYDEGTYQSADHSYPFAVVDFLPTNLEQKLGFGAPQITRLEAIRYVLNVASGVRYLHTQAHPIIHRDIKPANILVSGSTARLGDLGLAKVLMGGEEENSEDVQGYVAMPRFYRTPELVSRARGEHTVLTVKSDIYQLGLVLYRAVTGFNPQKALQKAFKVDPLEDIELDLRPIAGSGGKALTDLTSEMLQDDPGRRPSAEQVVNRLSVIHHEVCQADLNATGMMR